MGAADGHGGGQAFGSAHGGGQVCAGGTGSTVVVAGAGGTEEQGGQAASEEQGGRGQYGLVPVAAGQGYGQAVVVRAAFVSPMPPSGSTG